MSQRAVARSLDLAQGTVSKYLNRARRAGLTWPLPPELDEDVRLENRLYPPPSDLPSEARPHPDWAVVHRELRRPGVTLMLLWEEYCDTVADGFSYSWFCERYKEWSGRLKLSLRQVHVAGEKLFVDYSGHTMEVIDGLTGEVITAQIFVAVLGASNYTYAEATLTQSLPDWISSHVRAFSFFGGVARQTVSDNLKAGVTRACFHEPMVNRTYSDLARHYGTAILPARPYRPKDKAKVEVGVQVVGRWILARLRNRRFYSLAALNEAIHGLLDDLNDRVLRGWGRSRRQLFDELERPALVPCPTNTMSMPSGSAVVSTSIIMSRSPNTITASRTASSAKRSRLGSPPERSSYSCAASGWPRICAAPCHIGPRRSPSICRVRIGAIGTGRTNASAVRRPRSGPMPTR
jgi:transposase